MEKSETWFFFLFSRLRVFHVNLTTLKKLDFDLHGHIMDFLPNSNKKVFYFWNLDERSAIGWIERKSKFQIFPIFIFCVMVIFVKKSPQFSMITRKKKRRIFLIIFPGLFSTLRIFHNHFLRPPLLRGGGSLDVGNCDKASNLILT